MSIHSFHTWTGVAVSLSILCSIAGATGYELPVPSARVHTQTQGNVRVSTAVPSDRETREIFGQPLYRDNVQPVWIKAQNLGDTPVWFLPVGLDPDYFTPLEVAFRYHARNPSGNDALNRRFFESRMGIEIQPGETRVGYVFTELDEGTKAFNVELATPGRTETMTFFVPVPGLRVDHHNVDWQGLYSADEIVEYDNPQSLVQALQALPCCATDKQGNGLADPLNIVVIGEITHAYRAFLRAGWDETETIYGASLFKTAISAVWKSEYRYSPVSALYLYGRAQDIALQKARENIHERNHLRLWLAPMRFQGQSVLAGQISRDIGVRFTAKTITTHKIDPDVDETREFLLEDLAYAQGLTKFGYVEGVGAAPIDAPRGNLTGDPYFTDGQRIVLWIASEPVDTAEIELVDMRAANP
ncbi:MAG: LssY C-terminal domain-containing protein [Gammaproteobacteria bacterium]|nr:LssY C-terminal domain-containing protein [Gammaproteobacteria bacterium]